MLRASEIRGTMYQSFRGRSNGQVPSMEIKVEIIRMFYGGVMGTNVIN